MSENGSIRMHVLEYSSPKIKDNVIVGVKIVGTESNKGYTYPVPVLKAAMPQYEGAPVFILHGSESEKKRGARQLSDHFGTLQNVRQKQNGKGLYGDLHIRSEHPLAHAVLEEAAGAARFGLSHNAFVRSNKEKTEVLEILEVYSVDLVDNPGTTHNLFESDDSDAKVIKDMQERIEALEAANKRATKRFSAFESIADDERDGPVIGNSHDDFMGVIRGFPVLNEG